VRAAEKWGADFPAKYEASFVALARLLETVIAA